MLMILLLTCATVVAMSFLCSLIEAVLLSLNPLWLKTRQDQPHGGSQRWLALKHNIERPISAILIFSTLASTGLATLAGALFSATCGTEWFWLFTATMSFAVLFLGEMTPKILGVHHAEKLAPYLLPPLTVMLKVCHPMVLVMEKFCKLLKSDRGVKNSASDQIMDIITLVQAAKAEQVLHNREELIIIHAATLSARRVKTAMVPAEAVRVFHCGHDLSENVRALGPKLHRSYPVGTNGSLQEVEGYIRVRELFVDNILHPDARKWVPLVRPVLRVNGDTSLTQLLALFLEKHEIAALVTDRAGKNVTGWITLDDVTQVLMGARI